MDDITVPDKHMTTSYLGLDDKKSMAFLHTNAIFSGNTPGMAGVGIPEELLLLLANKSTAAKTVFLLVFALGGDVFINVALDNANERGKNEAKRGVFDEEVDISMLDDVAVNAAARRLASNFARLTEACAASINRGSKSIPIIKEG